MASDARVAISTTRLFKIGSVPGRPRQIGQVLLFGASPNRFEHAQKILDLVRSWTCTSNPITGSYLARTSGAMPAISCADFTIEAGNYSKLFAGRGLGVRFSATVPVLPPQLISLKPLLGKPS